MSLRDELLAEQQRVAARIEEEKRIKAEAELSERLEREKREQEESARLAQESEQGYLELEQALKEGNPPEEYEKLYNDMIAYIRAEIAEGKSEFKFSRTVSEEYYKSKGVKRHGKSTELELFNSYFNKRLKDDGFYGVEFALAERIEYYSTDADYEAQRRAQAEEDRKNQEEYDRALENYYSKMYSADNYGSGSSGTMPTLKFRAISAAKTGKIYHYEIKMSARLNHSHAKHSVSKSSTTVPTSSQKAVRAIYLIFEVICMFITGVVTLHFIDWNEKWWLVLLIGFFVGSVVSSIIWKIGYNIVKIFKKSK